MLKPYTSQDDPLAVESDETLQADGGLLGVLDVAGRLYRRVTEVLFSIGLSFAGYEVLSHLRDGSSRATLSELDEVVRGPGATATGAVEELARRGLVRVVTDGTSGEPAGVTITPVGSARALEGRMQLDMVLLEFAAHFSASERLELERLLHKAARR
jgi:DNA-binding MarR family transcriptional regulator